MINFIKERILGKIPWTKQRSSKWPKLRKSFLASNPQCAACGSRDKIEVHHIIPFHIDPPKELDFSNLLTLCESKEHGKVCHLEIGHNGNYKLENPNVVEDAATFKKSLSILP